jgi:hypothetical protein
MTLEPVKATAEVGENSELADMTRRFWVALVLTLPVFVLEMGSHIPGLGHARSCLAARFNLDSICLCPRLSSCGRVGHSSNAPGRRS